MSARLYIIVFAFLAKRHWVSHYSTLHSHHNTRVYSWYIVGDSSSVEITKYKLVIIPKHWHSPPEPPAVPEVDHET